MAEKRRHKRYAKRLTVKFGEQAPTSTAFLVDISAGGMFIASNMLPSLGARIHIHVQLEGGKSLYFEGMVQRHKQVPPELRSVARGGFGVRFLRPEELLSEIVPRSVVSTDRLMLSYASVVDLKACYERELRMGGLFIGTERRFERDAVVTVVLKLAWLDRELEFEAKVVHLADNPSGPRGVAVVFVETRKAQEAVASFL